MWLLCACRSDLKNWRKMWTDLECCASTNCCKTLLNTAFLLVQYSFVLPLWIHETARLGKFYYYISSSIDVWSWLRSNRESENCGSKDISAEVFFHVSKRKFSSFKLCHYEWRRGKELFCARLPLEGEWVWLPKLHAPCKASSEPLLQSLCSLMNHLKSFGVILKKITLKIHNLSQRNRVKLLEPSTFSSENR